MTAKGSHVNQQTRKQYRIQPCRQSDTGLDVCTLLAHLQELHDAADPPELRTVMCDRNRSNLHQTVIEDSREHWCPTTRDHLAWRQKKWPTDSISRTGGGYGTAYISENGRSCLRLIFVLPATHTKRPGKCRKMPKSTRAWRITVSIVSVLLWQTLTVGGAPTAKAHEWTT